MARRRNPPHPARSRSPWWLALVLACCTGLAQPALAAAPGAGAQTARNAPAPAPSPAAPTAPLQLRWTLERNAFPADAPGGRAQAAFVLHNAGAQALAGQGWALYFTCLSGVVTGAGDGPFVLEQVVGTLYRLRPTAGFEPLAPGQSRYLACTKR